MADKNYHRLARLFISGGSPILRELFLKFCPLDMLHSRLEDSKDELLASPELSKQQKDTLFPPNGAAIDCNKFDLTLFCFLLRWELNMPSEDCKDFPNDSDHSIKADVVRIEISLMTLHYYEDDTLMPFEEFNKLWRLITESLTRLAGRCSAEMHLKMKAKFDEWRFSTMSEEEEHSVLEWSQRSRPQTNYPPGLGYERPTDEPRKDRAVKIDTALAKVKQHESPLSVSNTNYSSCTIFSGTFVFPPSSEEGKGRGKCPISSLPKQISLPTGLPSGNDPFYPQVPDYPSFTSNITREDGASASPRDSQRTCKSRAQSEPTLPYDRRHSGQMDGDTLLHQVNQRFASNMRAVTPMRTSLQDIGPSAPSLSLCPSLCGDDDDNAFSTNSLPRAKTEHQNDVVSSANGGPKLDDSDESDSENDDYHMLAPSDKPSPDLECADVFSESLPPLPSGQEAREERLSTLPRNIPHNTYQSAESYSGQQRYSVDTGSVGYPPMFYVGDASPSCSGLYFDAQQGSIITSSSAPTLHALQRDESATAQHGQEDRGVSLHLCLKIKENVSSTPRSGDRKINLLRKALSMCFDEEESARGGSTQFRRYLEDGKEFTVEKVDYQNDCCIITIAPHSQHSLEELWHDFITGDLDQIAQETLLNQDDEEDIPLCPQLRVDIDAAEYKTCCLQLKPKGYSTQDSLHSPTTRHSQSLDDLGHHAAVTEVLEVLCRNGGSMNKHDAIRRLSHTSQTWAEKSGFFAQCNGKFRLHKDGNTLMASYPSELKLCPYFLLGKCSHKKDCWKSHDVNDKASNEVFQQINMGDFLAKERLHLLSNLVNTLPGVCHHYNRGDSCKRGSTCAFLHVCKYWVKAECNSLQNGTICRKAHDFSGRHEQELLKRHNLGELTDAQVLELLNAGK